MRDHDTYVARSSNGQCLAYVDAKADRVTGYRLEEDRQIELWVIPQHEQVLYVADDCQSVMALYRGGSSIIWQEHDPSTGVLFFFRSGRLLGQFTLGEIYPNIDALPQSESHTIWLSEEMKSNAGMEEGKWFIRTVDGRKITFDPVSGHRVD